MGMGMELVIGAAQKHSCWWKSWFDWFGDRGI